MVPQCSSEQLAVRRQRRRSASKLNKQGCLFVAEHRGGRGRGSDRPSLGGQDAAPLPGDEARQPRLIKTPFCCFSEPCWRIQAGWLKTRQMWFLSGPRPEYFPSLATERR